MLASSHGAKAARDEAPSAARPATAPTTAPVIALGDELLHVEYQQYQWNRNDPPVRMIAKDEGFCFLSEVGGHFAGGGEATSVYIGPDGFWYLGGHAAQDLWAKAYSVKLSRKVVATIVSPPDPADTAWHEATATMTRDGAPAVREMLAREISGMPSDADGIMALADDWVKATASLPALQQRPIESHALRLYELAINQLSAAPREAAVHRLGSLQLAVSQHRLNDMGAWHLNGGEWSTMPDGKIEGHGNSEITLTNKLPADCFIELRFMPVEGMRTRIRFPGTDLYVGNEGFIHHIEVYGAETQRGLPFPYSNGDEIKLAIKFAGKNFQLYINGELMSQGTRKTVPERIGFSLSAGDDWDGGTTRFWDMKVSGIQ